jgi:hypothetical protein
MSIFVISAGGVEAVASSCSGVPRASVCSTVALPAVTQVGF